ncbi:MAG TPA: alpha/beta hydrolase [Acidimicrobiales bacterium]|nr:alpha/beta hydrolase [Acidimicrobiales bacterium]
MLAVASGGDQLEWRCTTVDGRDAFYGTAGDGLAVLFLHGWALGQRSYQRALRRLVQMGCQVFAPSLPGFGGTPNLREPPTFEGYADWVAKFLDAVGVDEPAFVAGHSFGGGVAIKLAHDHPERVRYLVLVNSVGGTTWSWGNLVHALTSRPPWTWPFHAAEELVPLRYLRYMVPVIVEDAVPNLVRNPLGLWSVINLVRRSDLIAELQELKRRQLPVVALWGDHDTVIPQASFSALCRAIGSEGEVVEGRHSWLLADPDAFGAILTNSIAVAKLARGRKDQGEAGPADQTARTSRQTNGSTTASTAAMTSHDTS